MSQLTLFDDGRPEQAGRLAPKLRALAAQGVFFGTSSWKYEGWLGSIYAPERYVVRGKFSRKKFETECLAEYAETFPVAGGDFSFYQFPTPDYWGRLFGESPPALRFGFKVPEEITVATWPGHARYGPRAGRSNESFLDVDHFERNFVALLEPYRERVATLMFEFGTFPKAVFKTGADFTARLDCIPGGTARRVSLCGRDPQSRVPCARLLRDAREAQCRTCPERLDANAGTGRPGQSAGRLHSGFHSRAGASAPGPQL